MNIDLPVGGGVAFGGAGVHRLGKLWRRRWIAMQCCTVMFAKPLPEAVDDLYTAFSAVPAPAAVPHCNVCCVSDEEMAALLAAGPPRSVPADVLAPYASNLVVGTAGSRDDARYFMPRILDVLGTGRLAWPDLPLVGRFLATTAGDWPSPERRAIGDLIRSLWQHRLTTDPVEAPQPDAESILCTAAHITGGDIAAFLDQWTMRLDQRTAAEHLVGLLNAARLEESTWRMRGPWWDGRDDPIDAWLRSSDLRAAVRRLYATMPEDDSALFLNASLRWTFGIDLDT